MYPKITPRLVAYYRVSTERQGKSGVGLEAQQAAVADFIKKEGAELVGEFIEIESGKRNARPELAKAMEACRRQRARLAIAKLDRLSRNLAFIANLMESRVKFVAVDNPEANEVTLQILAVFAQHERKMISERTKAALAEAKRRGVKLGNPRAALAAKIGAAAVKASAKRFAANVLPIIREIQAAGVLSNAAIAAKLNERRVATARGGWWTHGRVGEVLGRA